MHAADEKLAVLYRAEGILQIHVPGSDGLNFGARKLYPSFKLFQNEVFMESLAVGGYLFNSGLSSRKYSHPFRLVIIPQKTLYCNTLIILSAKQPSEGSADFVQRCNRLIKRFDVY